MFAESILNPSSKKRRGVHMFKASQTNFNSTTELGQKQLNEKFPPPPHSRLPIKKLLLISVPLVLLAFTGIFFVATSDHGSDAVTSEVSRSNVSLTPGAESISNTSSQEVVGETPPSTTSPIIQNAMFMRLRHPLAIAGIVVALVLLVMIPVTVVLLTGNEDSSASIVEPEPMKLEDNKETGDQEENSFGDPANDPIKTDEEDEVPIGLIVGFSIVGVLAVVAAGVAIWFVKKRCCKPIEQPKSEKEILIDEIADNVCKIMQPSSGKSKEYDNLFNSCLSQLSYSCQLHLLLNPLCQLRNIDEPEFDTPQETAFNGYLDILIKFFEIEFKGTVKDKQRLRVQKLKAVLSKYKDNHDHQNKLKTARDLSNDHELFMRNGVSESPEILFFLFRILDKHGKSISHHETFQLAGNYVNECLGNLPDEELRNLSEFLKNRIR